MKKGEPTLVAGLDGASAAIDFLGAGREGERVDGLRGSSLRGIAIEEREGEEREGEEREGEG